MSCHRKFHMNLTSLKRSPVLKGHFFTQRWPLNTGLTVVDISLKIIILKDTGDIYNYNQHKKIMPVIIHLFNKIELSAPI